MFHCQWTHNQVFPLCTQSCFRSRDKPADIYVVIQPVYLPGVLMTTDISKDVLLPDSLSHFSIIIQIWWKCLIQILMDWVLQFFYPLAFQAQWGIIVACVYPSVHPIIRLSVRVWTLPCQHDNSSHICARITQFAPNMHPGILLASVENRGHWPYPSRSFWPFCPRILGNLTCPDNNSSQIWATITKFALYIHPGIFLSGVENRGHFNSEF